MKTASLVFLLFATSAMARDPWLTQGGLSLSQLYSRSDTLLASGAGVIPMQLSGVDDHGTQRYSVLWGAATDRFSRKIVAGLNAPAFTILNESLQSDGWRLTWLNGNHFAGADYYNAIYRKSGGSAQIVRLGESAASFLAANEQIGGDGYYLGNFCTFRSSSTNIRYGGYWVSSGFIQPSSQFHIDLTASELADLVGNNPSWKLFNFCGYLGTSGSARYSVMLRRPSLPGYLWHLDVSSLNFASINSNYVGIGWRPAFVHAWNVAPDDIRYDALWLPNGGLDYSYIDSINTVVADAMSSQNIPALSLAFSRDGRLVFNRAWGTADIASGRVAGTDHRFRIASCSKAITGLAVTHALEHTGTTRTLGSRVFGSGALFGTDFGNSLLYTQNEKNITIRHLLQHVAGWPDDGKLWYNSEPSWGSDNRPAISWQLDEVTNPVAPGTAGRYSNMGFVIAARSVEYISGQSFEDYVTDQILATSGATSTLRPVVGDRTEGQRKLLEVSYYTGPNYGDPEITANPYDIDPRRMDGSTAWVARPSDLLLVARRFNGNSAHTDVINATSLTALRTPGPNVPAVMYTPSIYGLGSYSESYNWGHNGTMAGTRAEFMVGSRNSFAWAANTVGGISNNALRSIFASISSADDWPDIDLFGVFHPYYQNWLTGHFVPIEYIEIGLMESLWGPDADPDGDGLPNAVECYLGLDPRVADRSPFFVSLVDNQLRVRWYRKNDVAGVTIDYQTSEDLVGWSSSTLASGEIGDVDGVLNPLGYRLQELLVPINTGGRYVRFFCNVR